MDRLTEVRHLYDSMAETYDDVETDAFYANQYRAYAVHIEANAPRLRGRVLDLGCGTGIQTVALAPSASEVIGADISKRLLSVARLKACGLSNVCFVLADASRLPFRDATFDGVISYGETLSHVEDFAAAIGETARVLRSRGIFLFSVVNKWNLQVLRSPRELLAALRTTSSHSRVWRCIDDAGRETRLSLRAFPRWEVAATCAGKGFRLIGVVGIHVSSLLVPLGWQTRTRAFNWLWRKLGALDRWFARSPFVARFGYSAIYSAERVQRSEG